MPFTNSTAVQAALISWPNLTMSTAQAQDLMTLGEDRIYRELRVRSMETTIQSTITTSGTIAVPSDYVELKNAIIQTSPVQTLQRKSVDWINTHYPTRSGCGKPHFIARDGANFVFGPSSDSTYVVSLNYYKRQATAVNGTLEGILLDAPGLWLYASLCETEPLFGRDTRLPVWEAKYTQIKNLVELEDKREQSSGAPLAMTPG